MSDVKYDPNHDLRLDILIKEMQRPQGEGRASKVQVLRDAFLGTIEKGFWRLGEKLPGERELAERLSLSLGTVQAAMGSLASTGLIVRRRGAGSFIAKAQVIGSNVWHFRFLSPSDNSLTPIEISVLSVDETAEQGEWSEFLGAHQSFIKIRRIVEVGRKFKTYSEVYLDAMKFRPLLDISLQVLSGKNLRTFLHDRYNTPTLRAVHRIKNKVIDTETALLIDCKTGVMVLQMNALSYTYRDSPFSFQRIVVPPTDHELEILG